MKRGISFNFKTIVRKRASTVNAEELAQQEQPLLEKVTDALNRSSHTTLMDKLTRGRIIFIRDYIGMSEKYLFLSPDETLPDSLTKFTELFIVDGVHVYAHRSLMV